MSVFFAATDSFLFLNNPSLTNTSLARFPDPSTSSSSPSIRIRRSSPKFLLSRFQYRSRHSSSNSYCHSSDSTFSSSEGGDVDLEVEEDDDCYGDDELDDILVEIEKLTRNSRRIQSKIAIDASLDTIWNILTDYERLADFFPGLAISQLLEKKPNFARLYQVGQQELAFGVKFNAKGIVECYERDLEMLSSGKRRDIEFNMIEGDFQIFQGKWSIEQVLQFDEGSNKRNDTSLSLDSHSTLSYTVDVEPKLWLPVGLVEGRLSREIKMNLLCVRREARRANNSTLSACA